MNQYELNEEERNRGGRMENGEKRSSNYIRGYNILRGVRSGKRGIGHLSMSDIERIGEIDTNVSRDECKSVDQKSLDGEQRRM